ncbi:nicotinamide mononucleotide transporter family protein [Arsenicicoccus piscis]|uniref:Nicotinamide mononucleotide transporter n=1 Tax=Arsenicicoccus piscis TaxID=673954 RepID=A0ABQ6HSM3_9MICO|nr:nicotinamide mononucleotide transporter family protein [Arsenicicoccus piscis]MCH8626720.1 nicotinamide mononucleotide transporter family protein [Arsenicicoccus piscis]GMA21396.1 nicotinamide mononucleotide transporter [Arsenicicoccus piscis]
MTSWFDSAFNATLVIAGYPIFWREIVGNLFGFASAVGGMKRRIWAWPVGIIGNALLFTVFFGVWFTNPQHHTMWGQAFRQVFFIITSVYGWWRWRQTSRGLGKDAPAVVPRWATSRERLAYLGVWVAGVVLLQWVFSAIGAGWPAPRWYFWCDAWIFVGSMIATYAMARGWNDFWLAWIGVDLVGIPLLLHSGFLPSAALYAVYSAFVIYGFFVWLKASRTERPTTVPLVDAAP